MNIGFILTKNLSEQGFETFIELSKLYIKTNPVSIYLIGNGVYCARKKSDSNIGRIFKESNVYAYKHDLEARGIHQNQLNKRIILFEDYEKMVTDVMENFHQVISI
ncbi:MAG: DsrH/TusB family sulfur metabolism protein [Methanobacteriaceae archaeon]|nr:DsrH/TusB family sulfur metabolism protein [Methanobacteriaceae archaeon]